VKPESYNGNTSKTVFESRMYCNLPCPTEYGLRGCAVALLAVLLLKDKMEGTKHENICRPREA
jgi:hypothetical protein